jgi:LPS sulfotransferase NodH
MWRAADGNAVALVWRHPYRRSVPTPLSYLLCGTPRTGSTLLCSLLTSTGVAGRPESYFREPDQRMWARRFGVPVDEGAGIDYRRLEHGALRAGSTVNGVFAARIMWGTMPHLVEGLSGDSAREGRCDVDVLESAMGSLQFVHLQRVDVVGQAVSWARAEQTGYWQPGDRVNATPALDFDQVDRLVTTIQEHNAAWQAWFQAQGVEPLEVTYESVVADPADAVRRVVEHLDRRLPGDWTPAPPQVRQADSLNTEWVRRYQAAR